MSSPRIARCGVPQGSVLSPVLFGIYVNDLPTVLPPGVKCKQFADDLKLYTIIDKTSGNKLLQSGIDSVLQWSSLAKLSLNDDKTVCLTIGNNPRTLDYKINNKSIRRENVTRDLGFLVSTKLDFTKHWQSAINKAKYIMSQFLPV
uniref:Reverse transcriptase domain-containing protein n=1 Tax=Caenorhabditis japonica TaxID=281687 RepID=A0A8R1EME3_CAEJA